MSQVLSAEERVSRWRLEIWIQDEPTQICAVEFQNTKTEEQPQEPTIVTLAEAVIDPRAVVVEFGDAGVAE
jgi:hypothetical protein